MKMFVSIAVVAAAITLGGAAVEQQWMGGSTAIAQGSSACYQNCTNVRRWPAEQCRTYCRGKAKKKTPDSTK